jgi:mono/diheme cytochrome c family protein
MARVIAIVFALASVGVGTGEIASAQTASRVIRLIDQRCANCHRSDAGPSADAAGAPSMPTLRRMAPETILQAITTGAMRVHAEDVSDDVKRAVAEYLSGRKLGPLGAGDARNSQPIVERLESRRDECAVPARARAHRVGRAAAVTEMGIRVPRRVVGVRTADDRRRPRVRWR